MNETNVNETKQEFYQNNNDDNTHILKSPEK